ncbi:ABC transporter ATP-binding protein [Neolewinella aurantiaca]|uniref:ABC transporter ATP-binding protein n=1 Tax=Neolewinella aurantiaca TaxID=2602767 RepID=A0A5C7FPQ2_9BACT|nr:ABC transporter ATP-binding protein [Neolewinella aurantiaca]TXF88416.1 ABC transporter ATP-binding protein [Neolewinella aurantiaca]
MLSSTNLSFTYPGGEVLKFPDLVCPAGETRLLLGKSGSGKTTMLQLLAGLRKPATGSVVINGQNLNELSGAELDYFRGQNVGMIFQTAHFIRALSVRENLAIAQQLAGKPIDRPRIDGLLEELDLGGKGNALPGKLSVGQQQRAAIARAIINQPAVIFADEPTSALDDDNTRQVIQLLQRQAEAVKATLLIVTHDNRLTGIIPQQTKL